MDSLSEATKGAFHKNVLTLETHATADSTVLTFRAYGLDDESDPTVGDYVLGRNPGGSRVLPDRRGRDHLHPRLNVPSPRLAR